MMYKSPQLELMNFHGWIFYLSATLCHAATFTLVPYLLIYTPLVFITGKERIPAIVHAMLVSFINILACLNGYVFALYKFHINGFVLSLYFGEGGDEIFTFDSSLYLFAAGVVAFFILLNLALRWLCGVIFKRTKTAYIVPSLLTLALLLVVSNLMHAYAAVAQDQPIRKSATHLPYYFPLTANGLMRKMGVENDLDDYTMGRVLTDTTFRNWHVSGDNLNYAFIVEENTILEKMPSGYLEITDAHLKPIEGYKVNAKKLNDAITRLNSFYK